MVWLLYVYVNIYFYLLYILFMYLVIWQYFSCIYRPFVVLCFKNCPFNLVGHLLIILFVLLSSLYILDINHLLDEMLAKIFSYSVIISSFW
jgi:hypothetical protein